MKSDVSDAIGRSKIARDVETRGNKYRIGWGHQFASFDKTSLLLIRENLREVRIHTDNSWTEWTYIVELWVTGVLVISLTLSGSGTGVNSIVRKKRFWANDRLTSCPRSKNDHRWEMLRRRPSMASSILHDMVVSSICWPHQNRRAFSAIISKASW